MNKKTVSTETKEKIRMAHIGLKHSAETKEKIRQSLKKKVTQEKRDRMKEIQAFSTKNKTLPERAKARERLLVKKEWDGTIKTLRYRVKRHFQYRIWKNKVSERGRFCEICKTTNNLVIHHKTKIDEIIKDNQDKIINYNFDIPELWEVNNGQVLCGSCHKKAHTKRSKRNRMKDLLKLVLEWDETKNVLDKGLKDKIVLEIDIRG